jgi:hypothetical protein
MIAGLGLTPLGAPPLYAAPRGEELTKSSGPKFDAIGLWSEIKLAILKEYASLLEDPR